MQVKASSITSIEKQGFTLVEVALAVLAVGLGMVTIFGLYPAGLQNASDDAADTRAGLFAGAVFSGMRGAATAVPDAVTWDNSFIGTSLTVEQMAITINGAAPLAVRVPFAAADEPDNYLRYSLTVVPVILGPPTTYSATLVTCDGRYGAFSAQNVFYTEFYYTGM